MINIFMTVCKAALEGSCITMMTMAPPGITLEACRAARTAVEISLAEDGFTLRRYKCEETDDI